MQHKAKQVIQKPRGTKDVFGLEQGLKQRLEFMLRWIVDLYNYQKVETPIFESVELFKSTVGTSSDIVTKELFEFKDKKGRDLALRPEGTAPLVRALIENQLFFQQKFKKVYYEGPMFRYENPQQGRQRQFNQFGIENFNAKNPYVDAEVIVMAFNILNALGIETKLLINSLGDETSRNNYREALVEYLTPYKNDLSEISQERLKVNPLRILDDKLESSKQFIQSAPKITEFLTSESQIYFNQVLKILDQYNVSYELSPSLVRGLDYYTDTIFEFIPHSNHANNSQSTLIAGGRFDNLVANLGGPQVSGIGFALGIERILSILKTQWQTQSLKESPLLYVAILSPLAIEKGFEVVQILRSEDFRVEWNYEPQKLLKTFDQTKDLDVDVFLILGEKELMANKITLKTGSKQKTIDLKDLISVLDDTFFPKSYNKEPQDESE